MLFVDSPIICFTKQVLQQFAGNCSLTFFFWCRSKTKISTVGRLQVFPTKLGKIHLRKINHILRISAASLVAYGRVGGYVMVPFGSILTHSNHLPVDTFSLSYHFRSYFILLTRFPLTVLCYLGSLLSFPSTHSPACLT